MGWFRPADGKLALREKHRRRNPRPEALESWNASSNLNRIRAHCLVAYALPMARVPPPSTSHQPIHPSQNQCHDEYGRFLATAQHSHVAMVEADDRHFVDLLSSLNAPIAPPKVRVRGCDASEKQLFSAA